jgi:CHAD domain-containing protein
VARPREITGLDCEGSFAAAAARIVEVRAAEVFEHADRVLDLDDIDPVHDMRVATRRLRAALEMCRPCFPRKRYRKAIKRVKKLADALGERRDRDVAIGFFSGFLDQAPAADRGRLEIVIEGLRAEQREANDLLAPSVSEEGLAKLRRRLERLAKEAGG